MKEIAAIYFDLDNTLIDRNKAMDSCMAAFFQQYLLQYSYPKEQKKILLKDNWGYTTRTDFCQWFVQEYQPVSWTAVSFWQYLKTNISQYIPIMDDNIKKLLHQLQKKYQIGILTNGSIQNQAAKIKQSKLDTIFATNTIHISAEYGLSKPQPQLFQKIIEQTQLLPSQILYVGDDPLKDIWGANQVGIQTMWISHGREWEEVDFFPDGVVGRIAEIESLL